MTLLLSLLLASLTPTALAGPDRSLGVSAVTGTIGQSGAIAGRLRWDSGVQFGARVEGALVQGWYIDGWEVRDGTALAGVASATVPLIRSETVRIDVEIDSGLRFLSATDTDADDDQATVLLLDVAPMVTLPLGRPFAARVGWKQITHLQRRPGPGLEAQGSLLRGAVMWTPSDDLQLGIDGAVGGVFGFGGDGGKALAQAGLMMRWVPGAARTYTNH
ncbi:MAG: hypothetical protein AAFV53_34275 [Myxococcota bacterium]